MSLYIPILWQTIRYFRENGPAVVEFAENYSSDPVLLSGVEDDGLYLWFESGKKLIVRDDDFLGVDNAGQLLTLPYDLIYAACLYAEYPELVR